MNKKLLGISVVILVAIGGSVAYLLTATNKPHMAIETVPSPAAPAPQTATDLPAPAPVPALPGAYKDYTSSNVSAASGTKILFFHASWCPQCRQLDASITAGRIPDNVTIFKVDYDTSQTLRTQYGVTLQTTLVKVDNNGKELKKFVAYSQPTLQAVIDNLLP